MRKFTAPILLALAVLLLGVCGGNFSKYDEYVGEWRNGKKHGQGTATSLNGTKYVGEFHGQGTFTHANGNKYVGEWKDGKPNGQGTFYSLADDRFKGNKYVGEWKNGKKHGQGTATYATGGKYAGEFRNGRYHGLGTETLPTDVNTSADTGMAKGTA